MKITGAEGMSPENIRDEINRGGRLVMHQYCVSIILLTFKRPSGIRLIKAGQSAAAAGWPYVLITLFFGWWGIPWGPIYTIECLYRNLTGGIDVTGELLPHLAPAAAGAAGSPATATPPAAAVPPAPPRRIDWRTAGILAGTACLIITLGLSVYCFQQQQSLPVVLASGIDQPYSIVLNGETRVLKPFSAEIVEMPEGEFVLADAPGGKVVGAEQRFTLSLPFFDHLHARRVAVINPDRVAVLVESEVPYYSDGTTPPKDEAPVFRLLANQVSHFIARPDYLLVDAEERISMPTGTSRVVKTRLTTVGEADLGSLVSALREKSGYPAARDHLLHLARHRSDEEFLRVAVRTLETADVPAFFKVRLAERPVLVEWHRYYQHQMEIRFPQHDLEAEYRAYARAEPDNGALLYLLGRQTADPAGQTQLWQAALAARQPCMYAHSAMGFDALTEGRFADAVAHYDNSLKAGVASGALDHYRRHAYFALGRPGDLLPELAAARKDDPFDLQLAEEEIRATYAVAQDAKAAGRLKDTYLAAYKASRPPKEFLLQAEAYLDACIAYLTGDLPAYAQAASKLEPKYFHFRAAVSTGRLDEAAKVAVPTDADDELLLYLLAHQLGDAAGADRYFQAACEAMKNGDREFRRVAAELEHGQPDASRICGLRMNLEQKRILLTALGVRLPADRARYFDAARKLNYNLDFPHHFLRTFLASQ